MKSGKIGLMMLVVFLAGICFGAEQSSKIQSAKQEESDEVKELRAGKNFIKTKVYTAQEDEAILEVFEGLRVADVADGDGVVVVPRAKAMRC